MYGKDYDVRYQSHFKYEANWTKEEGCSDTIALAWQRGVGLSSHIGRLQRKLEICSKGLKKWSRNLIKDRTTAIKEKFKEIKQLQSYERVDNMGVLKRLQNELGFLLDQEDVRWKQRAKTHWLVQGDRNTKFYRACVNQKRKKNLIKNVVDGEEFTREDVEAALKQMSPFKSQCQMVLEQFFQDHWGIVGSDVVQAILDFLSSGVIP
ncbi:uncharacterized protein LOC122274595 [Carya illinoinensis]|uniref:uncharacterized protein LOC122274595 n=1 Tax=Carya illinoinensis TaxID=32201 RepID=UPI001C71CEB9|nr:uncharacterized protein LOC122274595 [Carya illinoinensis]